METNGKNGARNAEPASPETEKVPRRKLLGVLVGAINFGVLASIAAPVIGFIGAPLLRGQEKGIWIPVLDETELKDGETKAVSYEREVQDGYMMAKRTYSAYVYRRGDKVSAYDSSCPHLGCHVEFKDSKRRYVCPCHGGVFDEEGNRVSGPPPRGLFTFPAKIAKGRIWIYKA